MVWPVGKAQSRKSNIIFPFPSPFPFPFPLLFQALSPCFLRGLGGKWGGWKKPRGHGEKGGETGALIFPSSPLMGVGGKVGGKRRE